MRSFLLIVVLIFITSPAAFSNCIKGNCNNGSGVFLYEDGAKYTGNFFNGKFSGSGSYTSLDWRSYKGEWKLGLPNGYGTFCYTDNTYSVGHFKDGNLNGFGIYTYPDGKVSEGLWKNGDFLEKVSKDKWYEIKYSKEDIRYQVNEIGKTIPMVLDGATKISSVILLDPYTINFRYSISNEDYYLIMARSKKQSAKKFKSEKISEYGSLEAYFEYVLSLLGNNNVKKNCTNPSTRQLIDGGVSFKHTYYNQDSIYLYDVTVNKDTCYSEWHSTPVFRWPQL